MSAVSAVECRDAIDCLGASFTFLTPAFGVLFGGLLLGVPLGATIFLALGLIAAGLVLVNRSPRQPISMEQ